MPECYNFRVKKSKELAQVGLIIFLMMFFILPFSIDDNVHYEEVFAKEITPMSLKEKRENYFAEGKFVFKNRKDIKILLVPGHDDEYYGAIHDGVKEVSLNRELTDYLYNILKKEDGFSVYRTSDKEDYTKTFENFLKRNKEDIEEFIQKSKKDFQRKVKRGQIDFEETNFHNSAPGEMATKLYGINMWANEGEFDLVLHIHFNDYAGRYRDRDPKYNGFAIYIPERQFQNHEESKEFAQAIYDRLSKVAPVSNLKQEKTGIVEDQELIAIGSNESLEVPALLIEYGYIYEPQFTHPDTRKRVMKELAQETYTGMKDFFGERVETENYVHENNLKKTEYFYKEENYMLQKELALLGYYPPKGKTLYQCPVSGLFGPCTEQAVINFQKANNLPSTGFVGPMTREVLNNI
jgi:N-acetylmuramoyl-L-alanine amidase